MALEDESEFKLRKERDKSPKKIVVRKLPPTFQEEDFLNAVQPLCEHNYFKFVAADRSLGVHAYSRAYINFINQEDVFLFRDQFDGYVFVDQKGNEYPAIVEYAPFPKIPKQTKQRSDPRCGTIDEDEEYLAFLESLKDENTPAVPQIEAMLEEIEKEEKLLKAASGTKTKTPLLEYVEQRASDRQKIIERRRKEESERKKSREEERKKRKEMARKREEAYKEEREKIRQKREQREKLKKDGEYDREKRDEHSNKEGRSGEHPEKKQERSHARYPKVTEPTPIKTKRYSEVRKREDREKKCKSHASSEPAEPAEDDGAKRDEDATEEMPEEQSLLEQEAVDATKPREQSTDRKERSSEDTRSGRRIRNKDRPDMQLYRPGQSRLKGSAKTPDGKKDGNSSSSSTSPVQVSKDNASALSDRADNKTMSRSDADQGESYNSDEAKNLETSEISPKDNAVWKPYSYAQDRENRKKSAAKSKESSQFKSKTFRGSNQD